MNQSSTSTVSNETFNTQAYVKVVSEKKKSDTKRTITFILEDREGVYIVNTTFDQDRPKLPTTNIRYLLDAIGVNYTTNTKELRNHLQNKTFDVVLQKTGYGDCCIVLEATAAKKINAQSIGGESDDEEVSLEDVLEPEKKPLYDVNDLPFPTFEEEPVINTPSNRFVEEEEEEPKTLKTLKPSQDVVIQPVEGFIWAGEVNGKRTFFLALGTDEQKVLGQKV